MASSNKKQKKTQKLPETERFFFLTFSDDSVNIWCVTAPAWPGDFTINIKIYLNKSFAL